jgi:1-phosphofructokinase
MATHTVPIFAPMLTLTVTVESGGSDEGDEMHIHAGGQGVWVARMLRELGERPIVCGPIGGEVGHVIHGLIKEWEIDLSTVETNGSSPATLQDRRSGKRELIAEGEPLTLERHELDDLYGKFLDLALGSKVVVITGQLGEVIPTDTYRRLGHDLAAVGVTVVADVHGPDLSSFLEGGPIRILKVSDENLVEDGLLQGDDEEAAASAMDRLIADGAEAVVLSRAENPTLARLDGAVYRAITPHLEPAETRGAGDSMTAGLAAGISRGLDPVEILKLACAAGTANVTRHGLGSASDDLIDTLAERVEIEPVSEASG